MEKFFIVSLFVSLALFCVANCDNNKLIQVNTVNGPIVGETLELERSQTVHRFLGIPYAEPPVGELRFKKSEPLKRKWSEPLQATKWSKKCTQDVNHPWNAHAKRIEGNSEVSEDCLYLNVWTPAIETNSSKLRPVIMWIHGGALFMGTSGMVLYDGNKLANMADAVVVSVNYRLSTLGYLYSDKIEGVKGNQGLWDQARALQWIQDNIQSFGGDKNKVTIIGESAGGWSVSGLVLSPVTRNLFHNAVIMSGALDNRLIVKPEKVVFTFLKGIKRLDCASENETSITQEVMDCINKLEPAKIDQIFHQMYDEKLIFPPLLTVDGEFFTDTPEEMFKKGDFKTDVNLLADTVENEGSFMLTQYDLFKPINPNSITLQEAKDFLRKLMNERLFVDKEKIDMDKLEKLYFHGVHPLADANLIRNRASTAFGDWILNCPVGNFAKNVKRYSAEKASVFQFFFKLDIGKPKFLCSSWSNACHGDDILPIFGVPFQTPENYVDRERDVSSEIIGFISDFIRTGKPNKRIPQWEGYFMLDNQTVAQPYYEIGNRARSHESFKFNLKDNECKLLSKHWDL